MTRDSVPLAKGFIRGYRGLCVRLRMYACMYIYIYIYIHHILPGL